MKLRTKLAALAVAFALSLGLTAGATQQAQTLYTVPMDRVYFNYHPYAEDMALVVENRFASDYYGYIDNDGQNVIPCIYTDAEDFSEGLAVVQDPGGLYGFLDTNGNLAIPFQYTNAGSFSQGLAYAEKNGKKYFINKKGQPVLDVSAYSAVKEFSGGLAPVKRGNQWGCINTSGKEVIPCSYDAVTACSDGIVVATKGGKQTGLNTAGQTVFQTSYTTVAGFSEGLAQVQKNGKYGFINTAGKEVIPAQYDRVLNFSEGLAYVTQGSFRGYIDKTGQRKIDISSYSFGGYFNNGIAVVEQGSRSGYIDTQGNLLLSGLDDAIEFGGDYAIASKNNTTLLVSTKDIDAIRHTPDPWAQEDIKRAQELSLIPDDLAIYYQKNITRQEFCHLAIHFIEVNENCTIEQYLKEKGLTIQKDLYSDTQDYEILAASALGIVNGMEGDTFQPNSNITREQSAKMLALTGQQLGMENRSDSLFFADLSSIGMWARPHVGFVVHYGIMNGKNGNKFAPLDNYTRQEAFVTVLRMYDAMQK